MLENYNNSKMKQYDDAQWFLNRTSLNIDLSHRCPLECPRCQRQMDWRDHGEKVPGYDITMSEIEKLAKFYTKFHFCGQLSDPIHHPKFAEILKFLYDKKIDAIVHNASSHKPKDYYIKCFKAHPLARWVFGIDGLPEQSHNYRIHQDCKKLFNIMLEARKILKFVPVWQYIIFDYNEHNVDKAKEMAAENDVAIMFTQSSRWKTNKDTLKPKNKEFLNALV